MPRKPNFILISADNLGYGDWGCFGSTVHQTPHVDRMAAEGMRLTHFYASSGVCTPSRASLMTGCYPRRVGMHKSGKGEAVLMPMDAKGLHPSEVTVARILQNAGYATACVGKWHLGDQRPFLPTRHGFDSYFGVPYSDDMTGREEPTWRPPLPLMRNEQVIEAPVDRDTLTERYTVEVIRLIRQHRDRPFFIYLPHSMPGSTRHPFASDPFKERSEGGPYGDSIEEMDASTERILAVLEELGLDADTLVMTTSDHGPVGHDPPQGSSGSLKGFGYDTSEAAMRPPCVVRWPGHVPAGTTCDVVTGVMDVLPTFAALAGATLPDDRVIDGHDASSLLTGEGGDVSAWDETGFFYYQIDQLQAVRRGPWKLYLPLERKRIGLTGRYEPSPSALYHLVDDVSEEREVSAGRPEVVAELLALAERAREDLGDTGRIGSGQRPAGWIDDPQPCVIEEG